MTVHPYVTRALERAQCPFGLRPSTANPAMFLLTKRGQVIQTRPMPRDEALTTYLQLRELWS